MTWAVETGDCVELMRGLDENSVDAIVTDPPYGLGFMGKRNPWDALPPGGPWAEQCLRVLKPGGHMVAFGGTRTIHRLTCAIEDAGMEIRDQVCWQYYSGFPKSMRVEVDGFGGYGTALKPAYEPAILARKALDGTVAQNVEAWGTGAINVDACRYKPGDPAWPGPQEDYGRSAARADGQRVPSCHETMTGFLAGVHDEAAYAHALGRCPANVYACPKPSRRERDLGCYHLAGMSGHDACDRKKGSAGLKSPRAGGGRRADHVKNYHPTVKPVALMAWLCRLVGGRRGSLILDPFCGSGTTGIAALAGGYEFLGYELDPGYAEIAASRIVGAAPLLNMRGG